MSATYLETDCTFTHEGRTFESGGALVTPAYVVAYLAKDGVLTDWHGRPLGTYRSVATWKTPRSYFAPSMSQVVANVDGIIYTGRSAGIGCIYRGRARRHQSKEIA